jgi:hypothetical protein
MLLARNGGDDFLVEPRGQAVGFDIRDEAVTVLLTEKGFDVLRFAGHGVFQVIVK